MDYREYITEVKSCAAAAFESLDNLDELHDRIHEIVDGHSWIIYTARNLDVLANTDNRDAYFADMGGFPGEHVYTLADLTMPVAFWAMRADVMDQIARWQNSMSFDDLAMLVADYGADPELFEIECENVTGDAAVQILEHGLDDYDPEAETPVFIFWDLGDVTNFGVHVSYLASARSMEDAYYGLAVQSSRLGVVEQDDMEQDDLDAYEKGTGRFLFNENGDWIDPEYVQVREIDPHTLDIRLNLD